MDPHFVGLPHSFPKDIKESFGTHHFKIEKIILDFLSPKLKLHNRHCHDLQQAIVKFSMNVASGNVLCCSIPQWLGGGNKVNTAKNVEFGNIIRSFPNLLRKKIMRNFRGKNPKQDSNQPGFSVMFFGSRDVSRP